MFFAPDSGLIRLGCGLSASVDGFSPTWPRFATIAATAQTKAIGAIA